ncbi:MAG: hypothetical protein IPM56_19215 [Ignavibacteriales bacterium]|nr:MAG: hypothetical protein IPM56_19215 [Ignavibacteriales bacterium]
MIKNYSRTVFFILFLLLIFISNSCKEDPPVIPPPPPPPVLKDTLTVAVIDVTHRSASLNVQCTMNNVHSLVRLYRLFNSNETLVSEFPITVHDTTIIDDNNGTGLLLNTNYFYYAVRIDTLGERKDSSNLVEAVTPDTTSHNYTWQEIIIGDAGYSNALYDVWGTDENNVWAVGGLMIGGKFYGALHWNGIEWIPDSTVAGYAIYGFSPEDIWVVGGSVFHFNGTIWEDYTNRDRVLHDNQNYTSVWGTSSSNLYLGNEWGKIIHWDGSKASVVYDQTSVALTDLYGYNSEFIIGCGSLLAPPGVAIKYSSGYWTQIAALNTNRLMYSVYITNPTEYYVVGQEVMRYRNGQWTNILSNSSVMLTIRGNKETGEIAIAGHFSTLYHFNGSTWKEFQFSLTQYTPIESVYLTNNKLFAVGSFGNQARIIIGTRN